MEVTAMLASVWPAPADNGKNAFLVATAYAGESAHPAKDRFEVRALLLAQQFKLSNRGRSLRDDSAAHEGAANSLFAEFGNIPESFDYFLKVAETADAETSNRIARKVAAAAASVAQKRQAQVAIDRYALLGKAPALTLQDTDGKKVNLQQSGKITILYLWSAQHGAADWAALQRAQQAAPPNTEWLCLALDTTAAEWTKVAGKAPGHSTHCLLNQAERAAVVRALKVRRLPFAYVLERKGNLAAYGRPADLPAMLSSVNR